MRTLVTKKPPVRLRKIKGYSPEAARHSKGGNTAIFLFLSLLSCFMMLPLILMIGNAFKPPEELWIFPPKLLPMVPTINNFSRMVNLISASRVPFSRSLFNTVLITIIGTAGNIILSSMCAYPLAKKKFPGKQVVFRSIVLSLMFNASVVGIQNYITLSKLQWIDTYWALLIPAFASPLGLYLMKQFMEQIPDSFIDAARIDGASQWHTFWFVIMPLVKSAWLTLILLSVQQLWNLGSTNVIFSDELKTLPYVLSQITASGLVMAGVTAAISLTMFIVPLTIFILTQSRIIETMASAGIKE